MVSINPIIITIAIFVIISLPLRVAVVHSVPLAMHVKS